MPERVGPCLVEELRQVADQLLALALLHCVELVGVHPYDLFKRVDLYLVLGELGN